VSILILIIACINFANLSALQSIERAREIALRKILGESDSRLRLWMVGEALFISAISLFLSVILVENLLPLFNKELGSHIAFHFSDPVFICASTGLVFITGILSGTYPAFMLSSYKCVDLFSNKFRLSRRMTMRTLLVISQFAISIVLMICILMINRQMEYIRSKNLGMNPEHIINVRLQSASLIRQGKEIKEEMIKIPGVIRASVNSFIPSKHNEHWGLNLNEIPDDGTNEYVGLWIILADKDYFKTMEIEIIEGEALINNYTSSEVPIILNESAAKLIKDNIVTGKEFEFQNHKGKIIGITRDFHFRSMHHQIEPTAIVMYDKCDQISVRINSSNIKETVAALEKTWNRFSPDLKFDYYFLDDDFELLYRSETKTGKLLMIAGILSILLSSLGIFGIVTFSANSRSKEIGIRKVNGSTSAQIIALLSKEYTWWILISFVIACPVAYFIMHNWLRNFVYKTTLVWWIYALAGILAFLIALATISCQSWRVANRNPVDALRDE
jgi:putative ABC transport system permease protein